MCDLYLEAAHCSLFNLYICMSGTGLKLVVFLLRGISLGVCFSGLIIVEYISDTRRFCDRENVSISPIILLFLY
jgi:hypothetical protein